MDRNDSIKVSAISTTLNCKDGLRDCVEHLIQELDGRRFLEIVIIDGGSTDGTWELLQELQQQDHRVRVFQEIGANISRGRNLAVEHSRGNVILSFDSGCRMVDGYMALMTQPFVDDTDCGVTGGKTEAMGVNFFEKIVACLQQGTPKDAFNPSSRSIALRRSIFEAIGGYDESVLAGEDTHLNHKWRNAGVKYVHVPEARVFWRVRSSLWSLYKMQRRNVTGSVILRNPWGLSGWAVRLNIVSLVVGLAGLGAVVAGMFGGWYVLGMGAAGWMSYVVFRTMRRKRWKSFINPVRLICVVAAMLMMDLGTWSGTINGWIQRRKMKKIRMFW
ncbi:MAG: glycosyltransferase [Sedimentisphaerales bacterium]|nr:glycosyltransferase [Sedimentisphaerales bacterium]